MNNENERKKERNFSILLYAVQEIVISIIFYIIYLKIYIYWYKLITTTIKRREKKIIKIRIISEIQNFTKNLIKKSRLEYNSK